MGTQSSQISGSIFPQHSSQIIESDFRIIPNYSYTQHLDPYYSSNFTVLSHKQKSQLELQKYELFFNTYEQYQTYQEIYNWRNKSKYLVQARAIKEKPTNRLCGTFHQATLFLQRIPIRACEITDIPIQQGLYLLYTSFLGFRKIYERTGYFDISLDMICINKDALVKVWLNTNLSKIYPELYSINQNLTQTDFIKKILSICQPLIDFDHVQQKFSDFLKGCYFPAHETPKKQDNNKFCKYSKAKQPLSQCENKKSGTFSNSSAITFDKIIEYFQGYLNKHNLIVAREMKSIKDLFKIQQKIQFNPQNLGMNNKAKLLNQDTGNPKIEPLHFMNESIKVKPNTKRKDSKRSNFRLITDRSKTQNAEALFSYKSEEYMKNIKQFKQPQLVIKRPPSISFGYQPLIRNYQQLFSPQHISPRKKYYLQGRQRIKTSVVPNISFNIKSIDNHISPNQSFNSTEKFFYKNKEKQNFVVSVKENKMGDISIINQNCQKRNQQKLNFIQQNDKQISLDSKSLQKKEISSQNKNKKRTICYTVEQQWSIDEDIAKDLDLLENMESF